MLIIDTFVSYVRMNIICSIFNDVRFDQKRKRERDFEILVLGYSAI